MTEKWEILGAICVALTLLLVTWFSWKRGAGAQKSRLPPGPKGWPILGALPLLGGRKHEALYELSKKYGPLMFLRMGSVPTLVASSAKMAEEICKTNDVVMASRWDFTITSALFYNRQDIGWAPYGDHWRKARKICNLELFTASRIHRFRDKRRQEVNWMVRSILQEAQKGNTIQIEDFFEKLTMNIMTQIMWNKRHRTYVNTPTAEAEDVFVDLFRELSLLLAAMNVGDFIPGLTWLSMNLQGLSKRVTVAHQKLDKFVEGILREHKQQRPQLTQATENITSDADDFVDVLLNHTRRSEADQRISEYSAKAILADLIFAGTETTAGTMQWALAELMLKPHLMKRVQDELSSVVGPDRLVNDDDLPKLTYLNAVLKETLRLHPPTPLGVPRASTADCKIDGLHVPADTLVFINMWAIQRDPETWERPLEFDPQRFLDPKLSAGIDWKGQHFQLIPFGAGRRICPGMSLGSASLHLTFAQVLHCVEWKLPGEQKPEDMDMREGFGMLARLEVPLILTAKPRLSDDVICPEQ